VLYGAVLIPFNNDLIEGWDKITRHMKRNVILDMEIHGGAHRE
jgi:hypothetical protein